MNFHDRVAVDALLRGLTVHSLVEDDRSGQSFTGPKHRHVFHVIAGNPFYEFDAEGLGRISRHSLCVKLVVSQNLRRIRQALGLWVGADTILRDLRKPTERMPGRAYFFVAASRTISARCEPDLT